VKGRRGCIDDTMIDEIQELNVLQHILGSFETRPGRMWKADRR
jgi:hypothetical protein